MERWREDDPCALVEERARSIEPGLWLNLLVLDVAAAVRYQTSVLDAEAVYQDGEFAIMRHGRSFWMLHADKTYAEHPMRDLIGTGKPRGIGCEIRLSGCQPDNAEKRALDQGFVVLSSAANRPHGLREVYLVDQDGFVWVPSVPTAVEKGAVV